MGGGEQQDTLTEDREQFLQREDHQSRLSKSLSPTESSQAQRKCVDEANGRLGGDLYGQVTETSCPPPFVAQNLGEALTGAEV